MLMQLHIVFSFSIASSFMKRIRLAATNPTGSTEASTVGQQHQVDVVAAAAAQKKHEELERVIQEQASLIESLQAEKVGSEKSFTSFQSDHERVMKENGILRKAVAIQEERRVHFEQEVKASKTQSEERIKGLEQMILTLRYHLQMAQSYVGADDFMQQRPPDVY
jgi:hypothetical protein